MGKFSLSIGNRESAVPCSVVNFKASNQGSALKRAWKEVRRVKDKKTWGTLSLLKEDGSMVTIKAIRIY